MINKLTCLNLKKALETVPAVKSHIYNDNVSITINRETVLLVLRVMKSHSGFQFKMLTCLSGIDYPACEKRFKVVYELLSIKFNTRIRIKTFTSELKPIQSSSKVFPASNWYESEIWDMFGVFFEKHPNLTRILTDYGFEGYPLRKDFPLSGYVESSYDYTKKQVLNTKIELSQEYKSFDFKSPWETIKQNP